MTREKPLGSQVRHLLSNLSEHGTQHLTEIETDLAQTSVLLSEAIQKLSTSFMAIHDAVSAQQESIDALLAADGGIAPDTAAQLRARQEEIGTHVNAAITGLQFQDMTSQLIGRTVQRAAGLREVLDGVSSGSSGISESDAEAIMTALTGINSALEEQSEKLESALYKAVRQTHMESGDVELF